MTAEPEGERTTQPPHTILCVDDEQNILSALRRLFRPSGYEIQLADSAQKGLQILEQGPVDLVISDMRMPEMDGAQFLAEVKCRWPDTVRILLTGYADMESTVAAINEGGIYRYITKPWEDNDLRMTVQRALDHKDAESKRRQLLALTHRQNEELKTLNASLEDRVRARTEELRQTVMFLEMAYSQVKKSYLDAIPVFAHLIELREGPSSGHSQRVADLAQAIGTQLSLDEESLNHLHAAALLHDIGKIGLPDEVVITPYNSLSVEQRREIVKHPGMGQAALMSLHPLEEAGHIIRAHHERYDGMGFPDRLEGKAIPLGARILAVANEYDNLLSGTLLGEQLNPGAARAFIVEHKDRRYDPVVVEAFVTALEQIQGLDHRVLELKLDTCALRDGMVLTRDLIGKNDILLLKQGHVLTGKFIDKLRLYEQEQGRMFVVRVRAENKEMAA